MARKSSQRSAVRRRAIANVLEVRDYRADKRQLEAQIADAQQSSIHAMEELGIKSLAFDDPENERIKVGATIVESSTLEFDEDGLRKKVGAKVWNSITDRKINRTKLEEAVQAGQIDPKIVATYATEKPRKPFIRISEKVSKG